MIPSRFLYANPLTVHAELCLDSSFGFETGKFRTFDQALPKITSAVGVGAQGKIIFDRKELERIGRYGHFGYFGWFGRRGAIRVKPDHGTDFFFEGRTVIFIARGQQHFLLWTITWIFVWIVQNIIIPLFLFYQNEVSLNTGLFVPVYL